MSEIAQFALLGASLIYFWTVMFERFSRSCTIIAGVILIGSAGAALRPESEEEFFNFIAIIGISGLLVARSYLIWKEWHDEK